MKNELTFKEKFKRFLFWDYSDLENDIYKKNEAQSNKMTAVTMINCTFLNVLIFILCLSGVYQTTVPWFSCIIAIIDFSFSAIYCFKKRGRGERIKYYLMAGFVAGLTVSYIYFNTTVILLMIIPIVLSCMYYSKKFVVFTTSITAIFFIIGTFLAVLAGTVDANSFQFLEDAVLQVTKGSTMKDIIAAYYSSNQLMLYRETFEYSFLPNLFMIAIISNICITSSRNSRNLAKAEIEIKEKSSRIESELSLATSIQANMLPRIFPAFPEHKEFDIYAMMNPAKEVGGDFYDMFMIDDTHVAFDIGDVSGKGVPAALFMVIAKTLIKDYTQLGLAPAEVFTRVNKMLCEGNEAGLFVTAWLGVLDLNNSTLTYVNAGHNPPLILQNGEFSELKSKPGFVLAGMDSIKFKQQEITLSLGDTLFLYTDGVTEATDKDKNLYGIERLKNYLNSHKMDGVTSLIKGVREDVDKFDGDIEQFDDITMLSIKYLGKTENGFTEATFKSEIKNIDLAQEFVVTILRKSGIQNKTITQMEMTVDELFNNICRYGYLGRIGDIKIGVKVEETLITLVIRDSAIPFNPLTKKDPDVSVDVNDRSIGGLGIFLVKKMMDGFDYEYKDGMNVVTLTKKTGEKTNA